MEKKVFPLLPYFTYHIQSYIPSLDVPNKQALNTGVWGIIGALCIASWAKKKKKKKKNNLF